MTDLDSPRRNNDCYFYYYSTCAKGDSCTFRHEPSALGCETMCSFWKEGKCLNVHCNFRHMELRKNRKAIQCYWETQPGGCLKPHCPFLHQNVKQNNYTDNNIGPNTDTSQPGKQNDIGQVSEKNYKNPVDSLVVNFEEESDSESAPSFSPVKTQIKKVKVKTLEEIRLEKIQEESAAYFSYHEAHPLPTVETEDDLRHRLLVRMRNKRLQLEDESVELPSKKKKINFNEHVTLDDHIKILTGKKKVIEKPEIVAGDDISLDEHITQRKKQKFPPVSKKEKEETGTFKIKTLAEIRAERLKKQEPIEPDSQCNQINLKRRVCSTEPEDEVSSTSRDETEKIDVKISKEQQPRKRLKLKRLSSSELNTITSKIVENVQNQDETNKTEKEIRTENLNIGESDIVPSALREDVTDEHTILEDAKLDRPTDTQNSVTEVNRVEDENGSESNSTSSDQFPSKLAEEVLLLDDDDDYGNVTLKAEDELLDEIDNILGR